MSESRRRLRHDLLYYPFRAALAVGSRFPLTLTRRVGRLAGRMALRLAATDRRRALDHMALAYPTTPPDELRRLLQRTADHFGLMLAEIVWLWRAHEGAVRAMCSIEGVAHAREALENGRGFVLITGHCGNWELLNARLSLAGLPMTIAVREVYDPRLHRVAVRLRSRFGAEVVERNPSAGRKLARGLLRNRIVGLLIDQDIRGVDGTFVPFFGEPAWTPVGAAELALRIGCPVLPAFAYRRLDGTHHAVIQPPLPIPTTESTDDAVRELTASATTAIERQIRLHPEQWVWMHRRWRTRPA